MYEDCLYVHTYVFVSDHGMYIHENMGSWENWIYLRLLVTVWELKIGLQYRLVCDDEMCILCVHK